jgi:serine/threonine protein kinase
MSGDRLLGATIHGYRLERIIGEGSAARVYRARHLFLDRTCAVKVVSRAAVDLPSIRARFEREARALSAMSHPNIVSISDFGFLSDGRPFLAMELLEGPTLASVIDEGSLDRERIVRIGRQIVAGLLEAHANGIIHRDLKPANIMLVGGSSEIVKLLDFGIARSPARTDTRLTGREVLLGTPKYMAPEQVMSPTSVSPASDIYALGVVLYEMLAGRTPFTGAMMEVLDQQMNRPPPPLRTSSGLEALVRQMLAKDPEDRPSGEVVFRALAASPHVESRSAVISDEMFEETISFADRTSLLMVPSSDRERTVLDEPTLRDGADETVLPATLYVDLQPPAKCAPRPARSRVRVRARSRQQRIAAVLACAAIAFGTAVAALAAAERERLPEVIVLAP